ncbi:MAG: hypothetical protein ACI82I_001984 [Gammaproteobacteria bacterium]|jgi:hypothetical protein
MGEEHFYLLSEPHRNSILLGFGDVAGDLTGAFEFFAYDGARAGVRVVFGFGWAHLTDQFKPTIFGPACRGWASNGIGVVATRLLERLTFWADVLVALGVPFNVQVPSVRLALSMTGMCGAMPRSTNHPSIVRTDPTSACRIDRVASTSIARQSFACKR